MIFTTVLAVMLSVVGLFLSYLLDLPSGATIVLLSGVCFGLSVVIQKLLK
jgi:zinc transport system permease protein